MKVSVCLTVYNEEKSIRVLVESLLSQSKKPDEIVIVDGGSSDKTVEIIRHLQKKDKRIILLVQKCTRAEGRNLSVELSKNEIVAITDADCIAKKTWLERITEPFNNSNADISAGFYEMKSKNTLQRAESVFLGVNPNDFDIRFLPSTRSIAFRKAIWEEIGGFPESKDNSAEDTDFNYKAVKLGAKYARVKNAQVEWSMPPTFKSFIKKIRDYAMWDAKYGIWWHPTKKLTSHNIKVLAVYMRYLIGLILLVIAVYNPSLFSIPFILIFLYLIWSFRKVFIKTNDLKAGLWGIPLQFATDLAVMSGFLQGIIKHGSNKD
ncbi:hypothetical protein A2863_02165 [Candidatus Woesebacteria bacterium RIFCSPHIGHO2_01_FULL_38_9b]|uniref:Glycosyltransferase 2-like domain-containing protein n=1 Tax=Candidatus Woesebacteria bacterium RIFCSPHIGHO2_01_FULL_38_9b TaxID=1802493 RepID=A0A1F7XZ99_9BACT|nr:MAG: hypothetical protein A2863_02165 [Candidatus Woesebacteria bacterium RIFCSPHIGHO2_01_FULL_38_9b]